MNITMAKPKSLGVKPNIMDAQLLLAVAFLIGFGLIMVASASMHLGAAKGDLMRYIDRHLMALAMGVCAALIAYQLPTRWLEKSSTILYFIGLGLLLLVFAPGLGREANGAQRWIGVGPLSLQTSEFMKVFVVLYMAGYLVRRKDEVAHNVWAFVRPNILLVAACVLLLLQPDFGTSAVLLGIAFGMLFLAGAPLWQFAALLGMAGVAMTSLILTASYRMERITSFLNPWEHVQDSGYQLAQALIAFGRGEWTGVGLGNGIQKQFYLPEAHTDFVMAVIGEEFGLVGTLAVIALFSVFIWRTYEIGYQAEERGERFAAYVAYGIGLWIGMQAFINIGVNMGVLPTKGLTLPFLSYGSNSLIVSLLAVGIVMRIHRENVLATGSEKEGQWQRA